MRGCLAHRVPHPFQSHPLIQHSSAQRAFTLPAGFAKDSAATPTVSVHTTGVAESFLVRVHAPRDMAMPCSAIRPNLSIFCVNPSKCRVHATDQQPNFTTPIFVINAFLPTPRKWYILRALPSRCVVDVKPRCVASWEKATRAFLCITLSGTNYKNPLCVHVYA